MRLQAMLSARRTGARPTSLTRMQRRRHLDTSFDSVGRSRYRLAWGVLRGQRVSKIDITRRLAIPRNSVDRLVSLE